MFVVSFVTTLYAKFLSFQLNFPSTEPRVVPSHYVICNDTCHTIRFGQVCSSMPYIYFALSSCHDTLVHVDEIVFHVVCLLVTHATPLNFPGLMSYVRTQVINFNKAH